jgi:TRAP-type C4-dicarboxylate transport system substrate-binding protein
MRKFLLMGLTILLLIAIAGCGGAAEAPTEAPAPTVAPTEAPAPTVAPTAVPPTQPPPTDTPAAMEEESAGSGVSAKVQAYADEHAGGPGAIYLGDINQLVGPAATPDQGDFDGNVPLDALQNHLYVFESDYYRDLIEQINIENPTPLVDRDEVFTIQHACLNRALSFCKVTETFYFPKVIERTKGQVNFVMSSFPELGLAGPDIPNLLGSGTLDMGSVVGPYVAGEVPALEIQYLFGAFTSRDEQYLTTAAIAPEVKQLLEDSTDGGKLILKEWASGNDIFFFSKEPLNTLEAFEGVKTRAFGTSISDWINGMGADAQFVAFAEVYTALERGILDAGVTGAHAGHGQRWYEVTDNIVGPFISMPMGFETMNRVTWGRIPADLQAIVIEEGAKMELENLRLAAVWNETGVEVNVAEGMTFLPWSDEMKVHVYENVALGRVLPNWIKRVGPEEIALWNEVVKPWTNVQIEDDGSITKLE